MASTSTSRWERGYDREKGTTPLFLPHPSSVRVRLSLLVGLRVRTVYAFDPDAPLRQTANPRFVDAFA
jgi:hypothetical protein